MIYAALYTYDPERTDIHDVRPAHREYLKGLYEDGSLLASGPRGDGALLLVSATDETQARRLLDDDPFVTSGIVSHIDLGEWTVVYGPWS
ncbi:YciI family protein [Flaviflexus huanghaiensis]|uniref:YciI family protein n=1 Tax=Flaviflexus huanghaiensis TaxID=1111473 RepID=UPI0019D60C8A